MTPRERATAIIVALRFVDPSTGISVTEERMTELLEDPSMTGKSMRMLVDGVANGIVADRTEVEAERMASLIAALAVGPKVYRNQCAIVGCPAESVPWHAGDAGKICDAHAAEWRYSNERVTGDVATWVRAKNRGKADA